MTCAKLLSLKLDFFADDNVLFLTDTNLKSLNYEVNMELNKVDLWLNANTLTLNYSKLNTY